jgi:hypothetical protein
MAIDRAIAAANRPAPEPRANVQVTLGSGRIALLQVPVNLTPVEAVDLVGFIATKLPATLAEARPRGPQLLVPTGVRIARG